MRAPNVAALTREGTLPMKKSYLVGASLLGLIASSPALAQGAAAQQPVGTAKGNDQTRPVATEAPADTAETNDNEIVVTASRRERTLQDTPIAVSVTTGATIEQAQIRDLVDLQSVVPSLRVAQFASSSNTNFFIRGFGNGANNPGIEPSVGVFIDGVYRSRSAAQISDLPNVQRIEVLRGPQSTLFGKNASAGVISIITQRPQFDFGGSASLTYGNFNTFVAKAGITGPITDTIAFALSGNYNRRDGYARDLTLDRKVNNRNRYDVRGDLLFKPNDDLSVRIIGDYSKIDEACCVAVNVLNGPTGALVDALSGGPGLGLVAEDPFSYRSRNNTPTFNKIENYGGSAQIDYKLGQFGLTSITAYRQLRSRADQDGDFTALDLIASGLTTSKINTFTQELRLTSDLDGPFNFLLGGFYFDENIDYTNSLSIGTGARRYFDVLSGASATNPGGVRTVEQILGLPVGTFFRPGSGNQELFTLADKSYSVFGSADFKPADRLTLTAGFNYTKDKKRASANVVTTERFSAVDLVALGVAIGVPPAFAANPAVNPLLGLRALQFLPPFLNFPNAVENGRTSDGKLSYTLRAAYEVTDRINVYATYATGFKATSFNLSRDSRPFASDFIAGSAASNPAASPIRTAGLALPNLTAGTRSAGPENSEVYEVGLKASFPRFAFNVAVFQQAIKGFQSNVFTGTGFNLANAGKESVFGIEFDGSWTPVKPLTLFLAVTYLDPVYNSFRNSAVGDLTGTNPSGIPSISASMGATYTHDFGNDTRLIARADYQFEEPVQISDGLPGFAVRSATAIDFGPARAIGRRFRRQVDEVNASVTLALNNGFELSVYGRNLLNDKYLVQVFDAVAQSGSVTGFPNQPRTYGGTVRFKF